MTDTNETAIATVDQLPAPIRAQQVLKFDKRKVELAELAKRSERIKEITNTAGYQECHSARMALKNARIDIEKVGKVAREDATAFSKAVIATEKTLIAVIGGEEVRLQAIQDAWDAAREAERAEKARQAEEAARAIRAKLDAIRQRPLSMIGKPAPTIAALIEDTKALDVSEFPENLRTEAEKLRHDAVEQLVTMHTLRLEDDAAAARLATERAELERQRQQQAAEQAERDSIAREEHEAKAAAERAERCRQDQERQAAHDRQQAELKAERERLAEIDRQQQATAAAERKRLADEEAERQRVAAAERERLDAERRELDRQREEAAQAERDRLAEQQRQLDNARLDAERREREQAIANADLIDSAREACELLQDNGFATHLVTLKLSAALDLETAQRKAA